MTSPTSMSSVALFTHVTASAADKSCDKVRTETRLVDRIRAATSSSGPCLRATSTRLIPAAVSLCAKAAPTPSEPPAITAHGPYRSRLIGLLPKLNPTRIDDGSDWIVGIAHRLQCA